MKSLDHPNIVHVFETFENEDYIHMVLDLLKGDELYNRLLAARRFNQIQAATTMEQIFRAVTYMHNEGIFHRDIKPENFMFLESDDVPVELAQLKLIDFGFGVPAELGDRFKTKCGTPYYVSPQILSGKYGREADIWSCGIICFVLLTGYPPFYGADVAEVLAKVQLGRYEFVEMDWKHIDKEAQGLISAMLQIAPQNRPTAQECFDHPWVREWARKPIWSRMRTSQVENIRNYVSFTALKKAALQVIASYIDPAIVKPIRDMFMLMDESGNGMISQKD